MAAVHEKVPERSVLAKKPLVEAIFEFRWNLKLASENEAPQDPGFRIALGRYYDRIHKDYPEVVDLPTSQVPEDMTAYAVRHQFRVAKNAWPLTQIGPGILTVNDTDGYTWENFKPRIMRSVAALFEAYPRDIWEFKPALVQLQYIDSIPYKTFAEKPLDFLAQFLHTTVTVEPKLFDNSEPASSPSEINLNLTIPLAKPLNLGILRFATGIRNEEPSIVFQTVVRGLAENIPGDAASFESWIEQAHKIIDKWFFTLCRGRLLDSFEPQEKS